MKIAFCFGVPKSGTTLLQMILNAHPEVSCPSEHQFGTIINEIDRMIGGYNFVLRDKDERTARQGADLFQPDDIDQILVRIIELAAWRGSQGKAVKWFGLKDNGLWEHAPRIAGLFPYAKFIYVVRDPRGVAVSSWYHNLRTEPGFIKRAKGKQEWAVSVGQIWTKELTAVVNLRSDPSIEKRLLFVRYEDLVGTPVEKRGELFDFLKVDDREAVISDNMEATCFENKKENPFFRKGQVDDWKEELAGDSSSAVTDAAEKLMKEFGYL